MLAFNTRRTLIAIGLISLGTAMAIVGGLRQKKQEGKELTTSETVSALAEKADTVVLLSGAGQLNWEGSRQVISLGQAFSATQARTEETGKATYAIALDGDKDIARIRCKPQRNQAPACRVYRPN